MYLAIKEILHEKLRYSLIVAMITLITYLVFVISGLANGLASQNTQALNTWKAQSVLLNKDSNFNLSQSYITKAQEKNIKLTANDAYVYQLPVISKIKNKKSISGQYIGIDKKQFIYKDMILTTGRIFNSNSEVVLDDSYQEKGYKVNDILKLNTNNQNYKIVGFVKNAKLNIAPIIYGDISNTSKLRNASNLVIANAIFSKNKSIKNTNSELKNYNITTFINKLPGYSAQIATFIFMIGFLMIISLIVIAVFIYILTMQKLSNYAVLRAQGIPANFLIKSTVYQSTILVILGLIIGIIVTVITVALLPKSVPISFNVGILILISFGLILISLLASIVPIRTILKIDPVKII